MGLLTDIAVSAAVLERQVSTDGSSVFTVAQAKNNRYAIGFARGGAGDPVLSIMPKPLTTFGLIIPDRGITWFSVKDHGPMAQVAWYEISGIIPTFLTVYEIIFPKE